MTYNPLPDTDTANVHGVPVHIDDALPFVVENDDGSTETVHMYKLNGSIFVSRETWDELLQSATADA